MAKKTTKSSSSAAAGVIVTGPQEEAAPAPVIAEPASGPAGESVPAGNHNPESEGTSEGSGNPAAPATTNAVEGDTHTPESESGAAAGEETSEPVKPQDDASQTGAIVAEAVTGTPMPEVEAAASGTNSEPSQGAAEDDGSMAGAVHALVIEAGAESVDELLRFANLGRRLADQFAAHGVDPSDWLDVYEKHDVGFPLFETGGYVGIDVAAPGEDASVAGVFRAEAGGAVLVHAVRVKSTRDGFRRAGLVLSKGWRTFRPGELTEEQLKAFDADPSITVEPV